MTDKLIGAPLTEEQIRKLHEPIPGYDNALNGPCHCLVCDPNFHKESDNG